MRKESDGATESRIRVSDFLERIGYSFSSDENGKITMEWRRGKVEHLVCKGDHGYCMFSNACGSEDDEIICSLGSDDFRKVVLDMYQQLSVLSMSPLGIPGHDREIDVSANEMERIALAMMEEWK